MDDASEDVVRDDDQPQDAFEPKTTKTPNPKWFTQPLRPPTPDPEWNKYKLDWNNPERDHYPFDLSKPLPLQGHLSHLTVAADYFFNNDIEYLKSFDPERIPTKVGYDKDALKGIKHQGEGRKLWHRSQLNKFSKNNVYSTKKIMGVKSVSVKKLHGHGHLEEIVVKRVDRQLYKFKEGDFVDLHLNDIEDMLLLAIQHKLFHLTDNDIVDFIMAFRIEFKELYTPSHKPPGVIFEDLTKQKRVMRADELYKFSGGTLKKVQDELHHRIHDFCLEYNTEMPRRKWMAVDRKKVGTYGQAD
ncbi:hypothetical protein Tco_0867693 [Tanacetum coccineum]